jgi:hypothetical protein
VFVSFVHKAGVYPTVDYFDLPSAKSKMFKCNDSVIKLFLFIVDGAQNKLECLYHLCIRLEYIEL